jgi:hypothetical protein
MAMMRRDPDARSAYSIVLVVGAMAHYNDWATIVGSTRLSG